MREHMSMSATLEKGAPRGSQRFVHIGGQKQWTCNYCKRSGSYDFVNAATCPDSPDPDPHPPTR